MLRSLNSLMLGSFEIGEEGHFHNFATYCYEKPLNSWFPSFRSILYQHLWYPDNVHVQFQSLTFQFTSCYIKPKCYEFGCIPLFREKPPLSLIAYSKDHHQNSLYSRLHKLHLYRGEHFLNSQMGKLN